MSCMYCEKSEKLMGIMTPVISFKYSDLYLLKDQFYRGRCVLALKDHKREVFEMTDDERNCFFSELAKVTKAIDSIYKPDKINYAVFGDEVSHFHFHLVPKYKDFDNWGRPFCGKKMEKIYLSTEDFNEAIEKLRSELL